MKSHFLLCSAILFVWLEHCLSANVEESNYWLLLNRHLLENVDSIDLDANIKAAALWLEPGSSPIVEVNEYHEAFLAQRKLRDDPTCDRKDLNLFKKLLKMRANTDVSLKRLEALYDETNIIHAFRCRGVLLNKFKDIDLHLEGAQSTSLIMFASQLKDPHSTKSGPWPSHRSVVEAAYETIKVHRRDDKEVESILPSIMKVLKPILVSTVENLFEKYVKEPCMTYLVRAKDIIEMIRVDSRSFKELSAHLIFKDYIIKYNACLKIISEVDGPGAFFEELKRIMQEKCADQILFKRRLSEKEGD